MKTKQIIILIVIIVALAGAGIFAYMSFGNLAGTASTTPTSTSTKGAILPQGTKLDFGTVNKFNETGKQFKYPAVTPADTGLQLNEIISQ